MYHKLHTVRILDVDRRWSLYFILSDLHEQGYKSIVGIYRTANYLNQTMGTDIFISLFNSNEIARLNANRRIEIRGIAHRTCYASYEIGSTPIIDQAQFLNPNSDWDRNLPVNIKLSNLRPVQIVTSFYLVSILRALDMYHNQITGATLLYNIKKQMSREFGFITVLHRSFMHYLVNRVGRLRLDTNDLIEALPGFSIPAIYTSHNVVPRQLHPTNLDINLNAVRTNCLIELSFEAHTEQELIPIDVESEPEQVPEPEREPETDETELEKLIDNTSVLDIDEEIDLDLE
jgi:hypothetical protein